MSVTRVGLGSRVHSEVLREVARHREGLATRYAHMNTRFIRPQLHLSAVFDLFLRLFAGGLADAVPPWNSDFAVEVFLFIPRALTSARGACLGIDGHPEAV